MVVNATAHSDRPAKERHPSDICQLALCAQIKWANTFPWPLHLILPVRSFIRLHPPAKLTLVDLLFLIPLSWGRFTFLHSPSLLYARALPSSQISTFPLSLPCVCVFYLSLNSPILNCVGLERGHFLHALLLVFIFPFLQCFSFLLLPTLRHFTHNPLTQSQWHGCEAVWDVERRQGNDAGG